MPRLCLLCLLLALASGCASSRTIAPADLEGDTFFEVNRAVRGKVTRLVLRDGREIATTNLLVRADSASWYDPARERTRSVATDAVEEVRILRTGRAALVGLGAGLVIGGVFGTYRAIREGDDPVSDNLAMTEAEKRLIYPFAHGAYAVLFTTPIGVYVGIYDVIRIGGE